MSEKQDQVALGWVREEVNKTLDQARQALEGYASNTDDVTQIRFCISGLHQVRGTLQMLEFYGASLMAEELEQLASALAEDKIANREKALDILMQGIVQMPVYLERVQKGQKDVPMVLLPILNEIRAARGDSLLSESAVFTPNLANIEQRRNRVADNKYRSEEELKQAAKKLRQHYQKGLLGILKNDNLRESFARIHKVLERLEMITAADSVSPLWWIANGFLVVIREDRLFRNTSIHALLAKIERQIRAIGDNGLSEVKQEVSPELLKNLLYYIAKSKSNDQRVIELQQTFQLAEILPDEQELEEQRSKMAGPDSSAIETVVSVIKEDLANVKDNLDVLVRSQGSIASELQNLLQPLRQISDTLAMLGLGVPRDVIKQQIDTLQELINESIEPDDAVIMDIAGALLFVEASLSTFVAEQGGDASKPVSMNEEQKKETAKKYQFDEAKIQLINESRNNLQKSKDAIIDFMASSWDHRLITDVPRQLEEIRGGITMVGLEKPANLIKVCADYIQNNLLAVHKIPDEKTLDALADVLTSIEFFLEGTLEDKGVGLENILVAAEESAEILANIVSEAVAAPAEAERSTGPEPAKEAAKPIQSSAAVDEELIGDEVREIFLEEAEEELASIREQLPKWINDQEDSESLTVIRRSFHTLKGSGRLVGAEIIGELAWSIENLLNRIIDKTLEPAPQVIQAVNDARDMLPALIEAFRNHSMPDCDSEELRLRAHAISKGEAPPTVELEQLDSDPKPIADGKEEAHQSTGASDFDALSAELAEMNSTELGTEPSLDADTKDDEPSITDALTTPLSEPEPLVQSDLEDEIDPVLMEIFSTEAQGHIVTINGFIDGAMNSPVMPKVSDALVRALHTLKGSAHMAGVTPISEVVAPLETYFKECKNRDAKINEEAMVLLSDSSKFLNNALQSLCSGIAISQIDNKEYVARAEELARQVAESEKKGATASDERDLELLSIFLSEGVEILNDADALLNAWSEQPSLANGAALQAEMHTLKRGANMASLPEVETLAESAEALLERLDDEAHWQVPFFELLKKVLERLHDMLDRAAADQDIIADQALCSQLDDYQGELSVPQDGDQASLLEPAVDDLTLSDASDLLVDHVSDVLSTDEPVTSLEYGVEEDVPEGDLAEDLQNELAALTDDQDLFSEPSLTESEEQEPAANLSLLDGNDDDSLTDLNALQDELTALSDELANESESLSSENVFEAAPDEGYLSELSPTEDLLSLSSAEALSEDDADDAEQFANDLPDAEPSLATESDQTMTAADLDLGEAADQVAVTQADAGDLSSDEEVYPFDDMMEIFIEEAEEILENIGEITHQWFTNIHDQAAVAELQRNMHTLKGSARMAGATRIGELGHVLEDIYEAIVDERLASSKSLVRVAEEVHDTLADMIEAVKNSQGVKNPATLIAKIKAIASGEAVESESEQSAEVVDESTTLLDQAASTVPETEFVETEITPLALEAEEAPSDDVAADADMSEFDALMSSVEDGIEASEAEIEQTHETTLPGLEAISPATTESESVADNHDNVVLEAVAPASSADIVLDEPTVYETDELMEIFLEEAIEILDNIGEITARWQEDINNVAAVAELQRDMHTLKGSARMAGAARVGDLGHALEDVYEGIVDGDLESSPALLTLAEDTHDKLSEMVHAIQNGQGVIDPAELIANIKAVAAGSPPVTIVPTTVSTIDSAAEPKPALPEPVLESDDEQLVPTAPDGASTDQVVLSEDEVIHLQVDEDDEEILDIYLEEANEILEDMEGAMAAWVAAPNKRDYIEVLQRNLHTLKGGARLSSIKAIGDLTHEMESYFERIDDSTAITPAITGLLQEGQDILAGLVRQVANERAMTYPANYLKRLRIVLSGGEVTSEPISRADSELTSPAYEPKARDSEPTVLPTSSDEEKVKPHTHTGAVAKVVPIKLKARGKRQQSAADDAKASQQAPQEVVRVGSDTLENLVNLAGETSIFRSRLEQQVIELRANLEEMGATVERLRTQLRNLEIETEAQVVYRREVAGYREYEDFDPLEMDRYNRQQELTRSLGESAADLLNLKDSLDALASDSETLLLQQGRVNTELQERLMRTRMVPFTSIVPRLRRIVRQIGRELGKPVELAISAEGEMDRTILERMVAPIEHMLRNAIDHGIEPPEKRKELGKSETGKIKIKLFREGSEVVILVQDDGAGINHQAIRKKAIERGLINEDTSLTKHELQLLILEAGFSTAEQVTQISGRGVGMDVVSSEIKQMGGVIDIESEYGSGTLFTVRLPFTVSVNQALMVLIGEEIFAIPLSSIEGIVRVSPFELQELYGQGNPEYTYAGIDYHLKYLGSLIEHGRPVSFDGVTKPLPVLLLHGADNPIAVQVDDLMGSREIVVKSVGTQLSTVSGLSGATILGDGRVVLILDVLALLRLAESHVAEVEGIEVATMERETPLIMVVDDSITVRKVTARLLERHDYDVLTAKDGVDALTILQEHKPDVMLLDIEMPRMDGFELATIIRHDDKLKTLPIIMITSRTGEKHRSRAEQIGVNHYMGKPFNETELLDTIQQLAHR